jgi:hypothetical protein
MDTRPEEAYTATGPRWSIAADARAPQPMRALDRFVASGAG